MTEEVLEIPDFLRAASLKPLFIPLKGLFFREFERRYKNTEYRCYGPRWNERVCRPGRRVTLSHGYSGPRLHGVIVSFRRSHEVTRDWLDCYPDKPHDMAVIRIHLDSAAAKAKAGQ